jgi:hypothetical protein
MYFQNYEKHYFQMKAVKKHLKIRSLISLYKNLPIKMLNLSTNPQI